MNEDDMLHISSNDEWKVHEIERTRAREIQEIKAIIPKKTVQMLTLIRNRAHRVARAHTYSRYIYNTHAVGAVIAIE